MGNGQLFSRAIEYTGLGGVMLSLFVFINLMGMICCISPSVRDRVRSEPFYKFLIGTFVIHLVIGGWLIIATYNQLQPKTYLIVQNNGETVVMKTSCIDGYCDIEGEEVPVMSFSEIDELGKSKGVFIEEASGRTYVCSYDNKRVKMLFNKDDIKDVQCIEIQQSYFHPVMPLVDEVVIEPSMNEDVDYEIQTLPAIQTDMKITNLSPGCEKNASSCN